MSKFRLIRFMDASDSRRSHAEALTEEIPVHILIDNALQFTGAKEGLCMIDVCSVLNSKRKRGGKDRELFTVPAKSLAP